MNWNLIITMVLLACILFAIVRIIKSKNQQINELRQSSLGSKEEVPVQDDIIAVRRINPCAASTEPEVSEAPYGGKSIEDKASRESLASSDTMPVMMFLLAKDERRFAGYELLQTVLAAGLRFGEGHLFHRHQQLNGQGPVLCSLAAATKTGMFDLQNMGAFSVRGLCLFMHGCGNEAIDTERFSIMLETAKQLSEGLNAHLLDENREPLSEASLYSYYQRLGIQNNLSHLLEA